MTRVGVIGAAGYGGGEVIRLLLQHPRVEVTAAFDIAYVGREMGEAVGGFRGLLHLRFEEFSLESALEEADVFFLALGNGQATKMVPDLLRAGKKCIDLSADFRFSSRAAYRRWYGISAPPTSLLKRAAYGIPELNREAIRTAELLANPGCYPTGVLLPLGALVEEDLIEPTDIIVDSKSGVSGAGRSSLELDYHFPECNESIKPYKVGAHRHQPEMEEQLSRLGGREFKICFTPHLVPMQRGILSMVYTRPKKRLTTAGVLRLLRKRYAGDVFLRILPEGEMPETRFVAGSNFCDIGALVDRRTDRLILMSAIDNLVKGAAGQAIQNMNLMCGFEESEGLLQAPLFP